MLKNIGVLWRVKDSETVIASGNIELLGEPIKVMICKVKEKKKDSYPDFNIVRAFDDEEGKGEKTSKKRNDSDEVPF